MENNKQNNEEKRCELQSIQVEPLNDVETGTPDESMCASYECEYCEE